MKTLINSLVLLVFLFSVFGKGYTQTQDTIPNFQDSVKVILLEKDTLVIITPKQLGLVNGIVLEREFLITELDLTNQIISEDLVIMEAKDSIIYEQSIMFDKQTVYYTDQMTELQKQLKKEKRSKILTNGALGVAAVVLGALLIIN